jgi:hypothetical protein
MRFIRIEIMSDEEVVVNVSRITKIYRCLSGPYQGVHIRVGDSDLYTKFTTIEAAVDYVQRAPSVSLGVA